MNWANPGFIVMIIIICIGLPLGIWQEVRTWQRKDREDQINKRILDTWDEQEREAGQRGNNISNLPSYCSNCGAALTEGQNFCPVCGVAIAKTNGNTAQNKGYKTGVGGQSKEQTRIYSSIDEVMEKAKNGDPIAQYFLADCYCNGRGVECNKRTAASWMEKSAEQGYDVAQCEMGLYYLNGTGVMQDDYEAVKWLTDAAWKGNGEAEYILGLCYEQGRGVTFEDMDTANNWFANAKQHGFDINAPKKEIAKIRMNQTETDKTSKTAETVRIDGADRRTKFCSNCGAALTEGQNFCPVCGAAIAKTNGNTAQNIGYKTGVGGQNKGQARIYSSMDELQASAKQGYPDAQYWLAVFLYSGFGGLQCNKEEAVNWMMKAAEQGYAQAQYEMGIYYLNGTVVEQDEKKGVEWLTESANNGCAEAQYNLGLCYELGRGVFQDEDVAANWFSKAADQGYDEAISKMKGY